MMAAEMENARAVGAAAGAGNATTISSHSTFTPLPVKIENIPARLKSLRWAVWKGVPRPNGKTSKAPCNPVTGYKIGADKPALWGTYEQAGTAYESGVWDGIGCLMEADSGLAGIDLDDWVTIAPKGSKLRGLAKQAKASGAYIEKSPSGTGLRLFVEGSLPDNKGRRKGGIELYNDARFLTVTGHGGGAIIEAQWLVDKLLELIGGETAAHLPSLAQGEASIDSVASLAAWAAASCTRLWEGRWADPVSDLGGAEYPSQSEADMALVGALVREARKRGISENALSTTVMQAFEQSGLYRPEKRRQVEDYAIPKAVSSAVESAKTVTGDAQGVELSTGEPGDIKAGKIYAIGHRGKLIYVSQAGRWLRWDGTRWAWCNTGEEMQAAKHAAGAILQHAGSLYAQDPEKHRKRMAFGIRMQNLPRLQAMVELAKSEPGMSLGAMSDLDADPMLLGVQNGVVDLRTGALLAPDPNMMITRQVAAEFHRDAECPKWLEFLDSIFDGDMETIGFLQRGAGYTLTGSTTAEVMFISYGSGANGKSVFANVVSRIMADYQQMAPASLLTLRKDGDSGPRNDVARLCGARLVQINELAQGDRLDEQVVKMLAGREMISARYLHKEFFDFWPTSKAWLRTNHRPVITGEDDGIWRRIYLIPFKHKFAEAERDPRLESKLMAERDGILAWMIEGCLEWQRIGLKPSALVRNESANYRKQSDLAGEFLDEVTDTDPDGRVEQGALFSRWRVWCDSNGIRHGAKASFTRKMSERGYAETRSNGQRFYGGLKLRAGGG